MPGITGIIQDPKRPAPSQLLDQMVACMIHEPFYNHGRFQNEEKGWYVGFVAIDGSFADCMPIYNERKDIVLFMTGECYPDQEQVAGLRQRGHAFDQSDASYLVHLYEEDPEAFPHVLNGWYNGLLLDTRGSTALLFNDRYGIRRVYYCERDGMFAFSTEAKSLLRVFPDLRELDPRSAGEFLVYDCVLENRSYFKGINLLPPGSSFRLANGAVSKEQWFDRTESENGDKLSLSEFTQELERTFDTIAPRYCASSGVALSLTGGLDTRMILACIDPAPGELPCFTFGGSYHPILDTRIAPRVAEAMGQRHHLLKMDDSRFLADFEAHLHKSIYVTDGLESVDKIDVIQFNQRAREVAPVRLTGKYGSQVLKGIYGFQERIPEGGLVSADFMPLLETARATAAGITGGNPLSFLLYSVIPWWWNGFVASESSQVTVRSPYLDNELIDLLYRAPELDDGFGVRFQLDYIAKRKPELMRIPTTGSYGGSGPAPIRWLRKHYYAALLAADKMHIREALPFGLTHFVGKIDYMLRGLHMDRRLLGHADFRRYRMWFRDELSGLIREILLDSRTLARPYWNSQHVRRVVEGHLTGQGTYLREIRKILQLEMIHRVLIEGADRFPGVVQVPQPAQVP